MATWEDLKTYVNANDDEETDTFLQECWNEAVEGVDNLARGLRPIPPATLARCYKEAGEKLFNRKAALNGAAQFASFDGAPVLTAKDPFITVYPILKRYSRTA